MKLANTHCSLATMVFPFLAAAACGPTQAPQLGVREIEISEGDGSVRRWDISYFGETGMVDQVVHSRDGEKSETLDV